VKIDYEYLGELVYTFYLSSAAAGRVGFTKSERLALSEYDDHPEKTGDVTPASSKRFNELLID
jgi:hypothetical protein